MYDENDTIMYVGKAVNLHNRVRSYFRKIVGRGPQIDRMVQRLVRFEYIVTDSELEALVLENNLIKENRPKYNTMLKDDKTYPYIKVTVAEPFPRILFCRTQKRDRARYFGPFTSPQAVRDTIELLDRMYGLRDCNRTLPGAQGAERPCLNYHMKRCCGPCTGNVKQEEYRAGVDRALDFLSGDYAPVIRDLTQRMESASEEMNYEEAMRLRDLIASVKEVAQKQKITEDIGENRDVLAVAKEEENTDADAVVQTFFIREGRMIGREHFCMTHVGGCTKAEILSDFIRQFYAGTPYIPRTLMLQEEISDREVVEQWLSARRGSKVTVEVPQRGRKEKLVEMARENAELILERDKERLKREEGRTIGAVREVAELLHIPKADRMEAFDISNISGFANVGSMVVFEKGRPKRSDYRKFAIRSVTGPDDYACMREVLTRRFRHGLEERRKLAEEGGNRDGGEGTPQEELGSFTRFPDLILMDGGRGQVNVALEVLGELGLSIPVAGMVKDDSHRTRGLYFAGRETAIGHSSEGFKLITRIQDEAHRFAIEYHRSLRSRAQTESRLDAIPGVGPVRRRALMQAFPSISALEQADADTIAAVPGISRAEAENIHAFLHREGASGG
ncbi:MAG: excinuclease ABC subunit UvrC [Lachnospiraceae bacterium]|nr:excinuclease ABC subunit UvrC [Lachnospiraceae bacterium]